MSASTTRQAPTLARALPSCSACQPSLTRLALALPSLPPQDRAQAKALFVSPTGEPTPLAASFSASAAGAPSLLTGVRTFEPGQEPTVEQAATTGKAGRLLTKDEKERVRAAIEAAESVDEIRRLQRMLAQGFVPTDKDLKVLAKDKAKAAADAMDH